MIYFFIVSDLWALIAAESPYVGCLLKLEAILGYLAEYEYVSFSLKTLLMSPSALQYSHPITRKLTMTRDTRK